jgi:hypothetical protein
MKENSIKTFPGLKNAKQLKNTAGLTKQTKKREKFCTNSLLNNFTLEHFLCVNFA